MPLHLACANGYPDVVSLLVERKCNLNLRDNDSLMPLIMALQCQQEECAIILLKHGVDPNLVDTNNAALHYVASGQNTAIAAKLLRHKMDIEAKNKGLTQLAQCHTKIGVFVNLCHHILFLFCLDLVQDIQHSTGKHLSSPVLESPHIGNVNNGMFFSRSLILRRNLVYSNGNILSSKSRVEGYLAKMQQELVEGTARELDEGTSELESKS